MHPCVRVCVPNVTLSIAKIEPKLGQSKLCEAQPCEQCGLFHLLGRDQKIEMKLGCENFMSQNTIVQ